MRIDEVWHVNGKNFVPPHLAWPVELSDVELTGLTANYAVMLYRNHGELVLALDEPRGRFRQR